MSEHMRIGGTSIQYYFTCHRELWLYMNHIDPIQDDENIMIGRLINEKALQKRGKREVTIGDSKIDILQSGKTSKIIEVKKSSKLLGPTTRQLQYYIYLLSKQGIYVEGEISIPKERKRIPVTLKDEDIRVLENAISDIQRIARMENIPEYIKKPYCKGCAYREFCEV